MDSLRRGSRKSNIILIIEIVLLSFFIKPTSTQDILFNLNTKKVVAITSDKFLSLTFDPAVLLTGDVLTSSTELSINMAKALAPGYVRIAGPRSNSYIFERSLFPQSGNQDPDFNIFSEAHWVLIQQWAQRSGLDVVSTLTPQRIENDDQTTSWDPRNSLELISFSDHMGYNISWQLGYECQTRCDISGFDLGKDITRLRNILGAFPRYANTVIAGPDIVSIRGKQQQQFVQDYLNAAGNALSVITWHPDFAGITVDSDGVALQADTLAADKDLLYKSMGRSVAKKPLWIAESKSEECKQQFLGALVWARRLGDAAKLGVQVIMRQPDTSSIFQPTPDYWVSFLHKMLVGKEVLDTKLTSGNKTYVHFYCQCTKPSAKYDKGAVTIFGINLSPGKVSVSLKGLKIKIVHKYILMPGYDTENRMFAESVLLNNEPLTLVNGKNLPEINPAVTSIGKNMAVKLPSGGIGFWVIPGARIKSCIGHDEETGEKNLLLKKLTKKLEEPDIGDENLGHELEDDNNQNQDSDLESIEDIKSLFKSKKKRRKYWHSDETDDEDRKFKRIDTKKEFEKLEKLLKKNTNNDEKKSSRLKGKVGLTVFESGGNDSTENKGENLASDENAGVMQFKKNELPNSGEDIRARLEEYKNKLIQYEMKKKILPPKKTYEFTNENFTNDVDTRKAVEALALISQVEGAFRDRGTSNEVNNYNGETHRNPKTLSLVSDIGEEMLIEELEKSDKIKRMIDPKSIDKIYQFLMNNNNNNNNQRNLYEKNTRNRRDLEKLLGDDPLGLRKEGLFKKRLRTDEPMRERRFERRNRKLKDKDDNNIGLRKELQASRLTAESGENNFFGIPQMKPLENFPQGDLHFDEGSSSEEKSRDYDYVKDDDDEPQTQRKHKKRKNPNNMNNKNNKKQNNPTHDETSWVEESESNLRHMPNEYFEAISLNLIPAKTQHKGHGELHEPESRQEEDIKEDHQTIENDPPPDAPVIVKDRPDDREDKKAKETAVKKLIKYYDNSRVAVNPNENFVNEEPRSRGLKNRQKTKISKDSLRTDNKLEEIAVNQKKEQNTKRMLQLDNDYEDSDDLGSLEFVNSKAADEDYSEEITNHSEDFGVKKRPKRKIVNLDIDMFGQEMIREDAGNLKDCKCRVIRSSAGRLECKNCKKTRRRQRDLVDDIVDTSLATINDQRSLPEESLPDLIESHQINEKDKSISEEAKEILLEREENAESSHKFTENADLNGENERVGDPAPEINNEDGSTPEPIILSNNDSDSEIIALKYPSEPETDTKTNLQVISAGDGEDNGTKISNDEVVSSQRLIGEENEEMIEKKRTVRIEKNANGEDIVDNDYNYTEQTILDNSADANVDAPPSGSSDTKVSPNTGEILGSSLKSESHSDIKSKNVLDLNKLKCGGLKSDAVKSKLILNTEALSALIKENESRKVDVLKALETSTKLKSFDNTKYAEYQRKRDEKLTNLKDKLKERKAKILQQYRQELLDALNICGDEVTKNLKRREIWDDFNNQDEFREFIDKDKLAYLMINRPADYGNIQELDDVESSTEDKRYYPEIDVVQPLRNPRERKIQNTEHRKQFYAPKTIQLFSSSQESRDHSQDEPYYAIVESLENPQIFHRELLEDYNRDIIGKHRYKETNKDSGKPVSYIHERDSTPAISDNDSINHRKNLYEKNDAQKAAWNQKNKYERTKDNFWNYLIPEYQDGILYHRQHSSPIRVGDEKKLSKVQNDLSSYNHEDLTPPEHFAFDTRVKNNLDEFYRNDMSESRLNDGSELVQKSGRVNSVNVQELGLDRNKRNLIPHEKLTFDETEYGVKPVKSKQDFTIRNERDTREKHSNYLCLKEDSKEDFGEDEERVFKLVRNDEGHYEAVPISDFPEDNWTDKRKKHVINKRRKYSSDILIDDEGNYYVKNAGYLRRNLQNNEVNKYKDELRGNYQLENSRIDLNSISDDLNRFELGKKISPEEYELLMLIPVKKNKVKRGKRDLDDNVIDQYESYEDMNQSSNNPADLNNENENRQLEYANANEKTLRNFKEAQDDLNEYLTRIKSARDPVQLQKFQQVILDLESNDRESLATAVAKSQEDFDRIDLGEYLKQEIIKKVGNEAEKSTTPVSVTPTSTLFDLVMPKLESAINEKLENVGNLTESLEDFINEFGNKLNSTSETNSEGVKEEDRKGDERISYSIFHTALDRVKKFFDFINGISLIFRRY